MDRSSHLQKEALDTFFTILGHAVSHFAADLWLEILSQVFLPLLEDINLALVTSYKLLSEGQERVTKDIHFYLTNAKTVVSRFNDFFCKNHDQLTD